MALYIFLRTTEDRLGYVFKHSFWCGFTRKSLVGIVLPNLHTVVPTILLYVYAIDIIVHDIVRNEVVIICLCIFPALLDINTHENGYS